MDDLTPEQLQQVQELHEALKGEFLENESEAARQRAIEDIVELKPDALSSLKHIIKHSDNEGLKAKVAMWAYEQILKSEESGKSPLSDLLAGMPTKNDTADTT